MKIKTFENFSNNLVNWPSEVSPGDIKRYEGMLEDMLGEDDLDERMSMCDEVLSEIEDEYPDIYDDLEDEIKELAI